jgi:hypothetical protein
MCEDNDDIQTAYKRDAADNLLEATIDHVLGEARNAFWETVADELDELTDSGDFPVHHEFDVDAAMKQAIIVYIAINT